MLKKTFIFIAITASVLIIAFTAGRLSGGMYETAQTGFKKTESSYKLSFIPSRSPYGAVNVYLPEYKTTEYETAKYYAMRFCMEDCTLYEDDDAYKAAKDGEELKVYRNIGMLEYTSNKKDNDAKISGDDEAVESAVNALRDRYIYPAYEEVNVLRHVSGYSLTFIDRLGNLKNYAFPQTVELDECGNVKKIIYFFLDYKKIGSSKIRSMEEAYMELPDFNDGTEIDISKGQLVYFYENSIVQAGYLFEGEAEAGRVFTCYVKAAEY